MCKVDGCDKIDISKGYCNRHYRQIKKYGKIINRVTYDPNEFVLYDDYFEIILYNKHGTEVSRTKASLVHLDKCKQHKWGSDGRYARTVINGNIVRLHTFITGVDNIDHKDNDKLNNLDNNLRKCTQSQNNMNKQSTIGIRFNNDRWEARIKICGNTIFLGSNVDKNIVLKLRHDAEKKYFGEFAPDRSVINA